MLAIGAVLIGGLSVAAGTMILTEREQALAAAERELSRLSLTLAEYTARTTQGLDLILLGIDEYAVSERIQTPAAFREKLASESFYRVLLDRMRDAPQIDALVVVGSDGRVINSTRSWPPPEVDVSDRDYFDILRERSGLGLVIGSPVRNRATGEWTMFLTRRIDGPGGEFLGVVTGVVNTRYFEDFFRTVAPGEEASISLFRRDGVLLARHPVSEPLIGRSFGGQPLFTQIVADSDAGIIRTPASALDGIARSMAPHVVPNYPLIINVTNTMGAILAGWRRQMVTILVTSGAAIALIVLSGLLLGRQFDFGMRIARSQAEQDQARRSEAQIRELNATLAASLEKLQAIADNVPVLIAYVDIDRTIRFINKIGEIWYGRPIDGLIGQTFAALMNRPTQIDTTSLIEKLSQGPFRYERTGVYPDGKTRTVDVVCVPDVGPDGALRGYYTLATDVSDRRASEERVRELNVSLEARLRQLRAITDHLPVLIIYSDANRIIRFINKTGELWLARPAREMVGKSFAEILNRPPVVDSKTLFERLSKGPVRFERTVRHPDGNLRTLDAIDVPDIGPDGKIRGYFSLRVDITERRATEQKVRDLNVTLEASLQQLRAITDNLPVLIIYFDAERKIRFINKTGEQWYARPAKDILGRTAEEILGRPPSMDTKSLFEMLAKGPVRYQRTSRQPDGKTRTVDLLDIPDIGPDGRVRGYYALIADITEQKATEEQLRQSQKLEAIGKLTGGIAHDFNNLLAVISGNIELAIEDYGTGVDIRPKLRTAIRATERGSALTESLLAFARQQPLSPTAIDLDALVRETIELIRRTAPANIAIELVAGEGLWRCDADAAQLQNALLNLVVNACDAMPDGGRLTIETANARFGDDEAAADLDMEPGHYVMLAVSDTGTGMAPDVAARAFEPFFTTKGVGKGTGLGLSMVYGFAKQSHGHAKIYSEPGQGTVVRLYLPRSATVERDKTATDVARSSDNAEGGGQTILVVEDNPDVRALVCNQLRSLAYKVIEAGEAKAALRVLDETGHIDLMLADVVLPGAMNGPQLAEEARRIRPGIKVLHMSGYTENALLHNGRLVPGVHLLQKPFLKRDLAAKLREVIDGEGRA